MVRRRGRGRPTGIYREVRKRWWIGTGWETTRMHVIRHHRWLAVRMRVRGAFVSGLAVRRGDVLAVRRIEHGIVCFTPGRRRRELMSHCLHRSSSCCRARRWSICPFTSGWRIFVVTCNGISVLKISELPLIPPYDGESDEPLFLRLYGPRLTPFFLSFLVPSLQVSATPYLVQRSQGRCSSQRLHAVAQLVHLSDR